MTLRFSIQHHPSYIYHIPFETSQLTYRGLNSPPFQFNTQHATPMPLSNARFPLLIAHERNSAQASIVAMQLLLGHGLGRSNVRRHSVSPVQMQ